MTLSRDEKVQEARRLRGEGLTLQKIANRFGVSVPTIHRWTTPDGFERDRERTQAWKARNRQHVRAYDHAYARDPEKRGRCESCLGPMGFHVPGDGICSACIKAEKEARWEQIEKWWAEGMKWPDICKRLGVSSGYLAQDIDRMRQAGRAVPYRQRGYSKYAKAA